MRYYRSKEGDTADSIAFVVYGRQNGRLVEGLLDANPGLADHGPVLPAGLLLMLPDAPAPAVVREVRLWG
ncbi:phage tail protein X [Cereibacter ovatus]|uniref:Phage tail protein X n=1 Tax=Cereibacter ovatus TaxID=439529 RepID=A0A285D4W3_9RHOB|nr:tail protein X [Cereibacter ovatus]SNX74861.1 phage tail protein X [Cereibacter ovatus]